MQPQIAGDRRATGRGRAPRRPTPRRPAPRRGRRRRAVPSASRPPPLGRSALLFLIGRRGRRPERGCTRTGDAPSLGRSLRADRPGRPDRLRPDPVSPIPRWPVRICWRSTAVNRALRAATMGVLLLSPVALSACSAGQVTQTATQERDKTGGQAQVGDLTLRAGRSSLPPRRRLRAAATTPSCSWRSSTAARRTTPWSTSSGEGFGDVEIERRRGRHRRERGVRAARDEIEIPAGVRRLRRRRRRHASP